MAVIYTVRMVVNHQGVAGTIEQILKFFFRWGTRLVKTKTETKMVICNPMV